MTESIWTSIGNNVFGLTALMIPTVCIAQQKKMKPKTAVLCSTVGFSACAFLLYLQIFYISIMVKMGDRAGLLDTINAVVIVSATLLIITILLNMVLFFSYFTK